MEGNRKGGRSEGVGDYVGPDLGNDTAPRPIAVMVVRFATVSKHDAVIRPQRFAIARRARPQIECSVAEQIPRVTEAAGRSNAARRMIRNGFVILSGKRP